MVVVLPTEVWEMWENFVTGLVVQELLDLSVEFSKSFVDPKFKM